MSSPLLPVPCVDWWCFAFTEVKGDPAQLDEAEQERYRAFYFERDRSAYLAAHLGLRRILAWRLGCLPTEVRMVRQERGKPRLQLPFHPDPPDFNLSHCSSHAAVAVASGARVGIDIETVRLLDDIDGMLEMVAAEAELAQFHALPAELRLAAFWRAWTVKEAVLKALGVGFGQDPRTVAVDLDPRRPLRLLEESSWRLWSLEVGPGLVATLAADTDCQPCWRPLPVAPGPAYGI
ncbi:4'-phosphopantetheinyl transferase family protein [Chitinimonas lacunae]|uniref:4'-phosphopantetheinyl transferase family protein n=1 Tax=Chitinimonas lacunae TaxID=1963018 RepID=A0ABV8MQZ7_9NEIS